MRIKKNSKIISKKYFCSYEKKIKKSIIVRIELAKALMPSTKLIELTKAARQNAEKKVAKIDVFISRFKLSK